MIGKNNVLEDWQSLMTDEIKTVGKNKPSIKTRNITELSGCFDFTTKNKGVSPLRFSLESKKMSYSLGERSETMDNKFLKYFGSKTVPGKTNAKMIILKIIV